MSMTLRVVTIVFFAIFLIEVFRLVRHGRLLLRYALLWMVIALLLVICAAFPGIVSSCSDLLGVGLASNFVFLVGLVCLGLVCLSLSVVVSWQGRYIKGLVQRLALLEKRIGEVGVEVPPAEVIRRPQDGDGERVSRE